MSWDDWAAWLAQALPRRVVMACLLRAVNHSRTLDAHRGINQITAHELMCEWREVVNGEEAERR